jgi:hypothetical protein
MKALTETDLVRACLQLLALRKIPCWRQNTGCATFAAGGRRRFVRFSTPGASDILGVLPPAGRMLAVEVKKPGGRLTASQRQFLDAVRAAGGCALVVRSVDELIAALAAEGVR